MAFNLTKKQSTLRNQLATELEEHLATLNGVIQDFNALMVDGRNNVEIALQDYNETLELIRDFAEEIVAAAEDSIDEKTDKWHDSARGEAAFNWKEAWESVGEEMHEKEIEFPSEIDEVDNDVLDTLSDAPSEAGEG